MDPPISCNVFYIFILFRTKIDLQRHITSWIPGSFGEVLTHIGISISSAITFTNLTCVHLNWGQPASPADNSFLERQ